MNCEIEAVVKKLITVRITKLMRTGEYNHMSHHI